MTRNTDNEASECFKTFKILQWIYESYAYDISKSSRTETCQSHIS